ncbi:MAG: PAS domain-containing protein, partial [Bacteroidota bacterium]
MIKINILLIEDNRGDARLITELLKDVTLFRSSVTKAKTMSGALEVLSTSSFEIILLDLSLPDSSGMETFASIRRVCGNTPVIVISGLSDETVVLEMINRGAQDFLNKSILSSQLLEKSIQHSIERNRIHRELQQSEEKYRLLFDKMINGFALHEIICNAEGKPVDYRFLEANESFGRMTKIDVHSIIGKTVREVLPETEQYWIDTYGEVALTGKSIKFTNYSGVLNKYFSIIAFSPQPNRFATVFEDITQLRHDEKKIETLLRMNRVLSNINQLIVRTKEIDTVFRNACSILVRDGGFVMAWIGIVNESTRMLDVVADAGITDDYLKKINIDLNDPIRSSGPTGRTVKKGIHHFIRDIETEPMMKPWRADAIRLGYKSSAAFPLKEKEKVVGAFTLYAPEVNFFTEEELHLLDELAMDISFAIEVSELERDRQNKYLALQESEYFFKESQRAAFVGSYKFDLATGIWESSEVMDEILGIDKSYDRSFQGWENIIYPDDRTMVKAYLSEEVIGQRKPFQKEYRIVRKSDGETRWLVDTGQFTFASEGKMEFFIGTIQDITERKVIEQTLLERENQYHFLADNISDVLWMLDLQTMRITYCSPSIKKLRGFTVDEVLGQTIEQMMTPASFGLLKKILPERLQDFLEGKPGAASSQIEIEQVCKNGSTVWTGITTTFIKDENGGVSVIGMSRDISEQKRSEEKLQESEERLRLSLAAAKQGLYDLDIETGKAVVNDEYATMIGYDPKTFVETNEFWTERLHPDDRERTAKTYTDYISGAIDEYRVEFRSATRQGEWKWILSVGKIIEYTKEGKPSRMMGTHTDI